MNYLIDYYTLNEACTFYEIFGYKRIEVPWLIHQKFSIMTSPTGDRGIAYVTDIGEHLLCSAEQGFLQLLFEGQLSTNVSYFSISPCFRNEAVDDIHSKTFIKLELFFYSDVKAEAMEKCIQFVDDAKEFLSTKMGIPTSIIKTNCGFDIIDNSGLELGSYGVRNIGQVYCAYGTGLALPRASMSGKRNGLS